MQYYGSNTAVHSRHFKRRFMVSILHIIPLMRNMSTAARNMTLVPTNVEAHVYKRHGSDEFESTAGDVSHCNYDQTNCLLTDGTMLIWDTNKNTTCEYTASMAHILKDTSLAMTKTWL